MYKNRSILLLAIFILVVPYSGFPFKSYLIAAAAALIAVISFIIERHITIPLHWYRRSHVTPVATTYIEHNGAATTEPTTTE